MRSLFLLLNRKGVSTVGTARTHWRAGTGLPPQGTKEERMACPWVKGLPAPLGWQRIVPLKVWRQSGFAVKCPPGGLGERLLVDLAELNFHVCTWTEHPEAHLLQHVPELLTAYRYAQSSPSPAFAMRPPPSADSEREMPLTYWFRATALYSFGSFLWIWFMAF